LARREAVPLRPRLWSTGSPSENAGDIQTLDNIDAPDEWKLYEAWLEQEMFGGRLSLLAGLYDVNEEFDVLETATLLINSSFGVGKDFSQSGENGPSIFPSTSLGVRIAAQPVANGYVRAAVLDGVPSDSSDSDTIPDFFDFDSDEGVLGVAEAGYIAGSEEGSDEKYTKNRSRRLVLLCRLRLHRQRRRRWDCEATDRELRRLPAR